MRLAPPLAGVIAGLTVAVAADARPVSRAANYFVHGLPGSALDAGGALPVDVQIGRRCRFSDVRFGADAGPLRIRAGERRVRVRLADGTACDGDVALTGRPNLAMDSTNVIVAHLDQNGTPELATFTTDADPVPPQRSRVTAYHTAEAPALEIELYPVGGDDSLVEFERVRPGRQSFPAEIPPGRYELEVYPANGDEEIIETTVRLQGGRAYDIFVVGSVRTGTIDVLLVEIETAR